MDKEYWDAVVGPLSGVEELVPIPGEASDLKHAGESSRLTGTGVSQPGRGRVEQLMVGL